MIALSSTILILLALGILAVCLRDALSVRREAITIKLIFLLGFVFFQPASALYTIATGETDALVSTDIGRSSLIFSLLSLLFIAIFLAVYARAEWVDRFATRVTVEHRSSPAGLVGMSAVCLVFAFICRDLIGRTVPILGVLTYQLASGAFTGAVGFASWAWFQNPRRFATLVWLLTITGGVVIAVLAVEWSRRGLVSAFVMLLWVGYMVRWRYLERASFLRGVALVVVLGGIPILLQSALRGPATATLSSKGGIAGYVDAFGRLQASDIGVAMSEIAAAQFAAANSFWLIDQYPESFPFDPLHQFRYFVFQPIPRVWWAGKPNGLGREIVSTGAVRGVSRDEHSLGPGIIGHCWVDVWWISVPLYASLYAIAARYLDRRFASFPADPFIVIPIGAGTAHVFGIPRGETGLFTFNALAAMVGAWIVVALFGRLFWSREDGESQDQPPIETEEFDQVEAPQNR